ncbi:MULTISPECIES: DUF6199 family natural product biosynthesis protein [unclassified Nocardiopsis]|uniref:DUF6199 family natural product biosynthesis protein n=1 Tax=unclassified Nocardiopsis TaxID=2649073 RepID=UPI00135BEE44|nr:MULTISPECIES: DUF6199 family natural product biosynthesis protein [unclassified Nocardiopsis]
MSSLLTLIFLMMIVAIIGAVVILINPEVAWHLRSWQYRDPEANYPSDAWFAMQRVAAGVMLVVCLVVLSQLWESPSPSSEERTAASPAQEASPTPTSERRTLTTMLTLDGRIYGYTPTDHGILLYVDTGHCASDPLVEATEEADAIRLQVQVDVGELWCSSENDVLSRHPVDLEEPLGDRRVRDSEGSAVRLCREGCDSTAGAEDTPPQE